MHAGIARMRGNSPPAAFITTDISGDDVHRLVRIENRPMEISFLSAELVLFAPAIVASCCVRAVFFFFLHNLPDPGNAVGNYSISSFHAAQAMTNDA